MDFTPGRGKQKGQLLSGKRKRKGRKTSGLSEAADLWRFPEGEKQNSFHWALEKAARTSGFLEETAGPGALGIPDLS